MSGAVAVRTSVEALRFPVETFRAAGALRALTQQARMAGLDLGTTATYHGASDLLLVWGPGAPNRFEAMRQQVAAGGHVVALDLAYWQRDTKVRVSIDTAHPQAWVMRRDWPAARLAADRITVGDGWNPTGPVFIAGIGDKATVQYGAAVKTWEAEMATAVRARGRTVVYRPKQGNPVPIERALQGASLVITWHSNVAVDAIRLGIPVVCRDGAAAAVCPSALPDEPRPLPSEIRDRFLQNLAWFQWNPATEGRQCWAFLQELLCA